ncbi:SUKH-4 family immunity protein [Streptomyces sp. NPDC001759]
MELTPEQAFEQVEAWLAAPSRLYETLAIRGLPGSGKTQLLLELTARNPQAVFVDCQGMTAEEVAHRLLAAWGVTESSGSLVSDALRIRRGGVAFLGNVQWADKFVTSNEANKITQHVIRTLRRLARPTLQFVVERSADRPWVLAPAKNDLFLTSQSTGEDSDGGRVSELAGLVEQYPALGALAAAELRTVSLPAWSGLCRHLEIEASVDELAELAQSLPQLVTTLDVPGNQRAAAFKVESDRCRTRRLHEIDHGALLSSLLRELRTHESWSSLSTDPFGRYVAQTVSLHAANAGRLEDVLNDGHVLGRLDTAGLLRGMAAAWPAGVPHDSIAADIHYLEGLGLAAASHEEWVSWLHHCALNRGEAELAQSIADAAGDTLPWRTTWTDCRPFGSFGRYRREPIDGRSENAADSPFTSQSLQALLSESRAWPFEKTGPPIRHIFDGHHIAFRPFRSKALSESRWLVTGPSGSFVADVHAKPGRQPHLQAFPAPFAGPVTKTGFWDCPQEALAQNAPARSWLDGTFGQGACRRLPESSLPSGLAHAGSRHFLTTVGLPELTEHLPFVRTISVDRTGLTEVRWPMDSGPAAGVGPYYRLGEWTRGNVLLAGTSGTVVQDYTSGYSSPVLATSLQQFCILLRLYHEFLISDFSTPEERRDARRSFREWAVDIDPVTEDADHWEQVFDGDLDSWNIE